MPNQPIKPDDLPGQTFDCECGRTHVVPTREIRYAEDALSRLLGFCSIAVQNPAVTVIADQRTHAAAGEACNRILHDAGWHTDIARVPDTPQGDPICDDRTKAELQSRIHAPRLMIAVGGGVINDLVKWIACESHCPYVSIPTAASMNGYTSNNIAPTINGVKQVVSGTVPAAVLAVPSVIRDAPYKLTASGLGDVLAKPVSMADWKLNHLLFDEYYCTFCARLIRDLEPTYFQHPRAILAKESSALRALFFALLYSGLSMTLAGTSFPASGGEHLISHALDMTAGIHGVPHDYHGRQVGLGTVFACALYERVLALEAPVFRFTEDVTDPQYWMSLAPVVEIEHAMKRKKACAAAEKLQRGYDWDRLRATVEPMTRKASEIKHCLREAGAAQCIADIGCSRDRFRMAALHCHQMRARYTIIDLARAAGILPSAADDIIDQYLMS